MKGKAITLWDYACRNRITVHSNQAFYGTQLDKDVEHVAPRVWERMSWGPRRKTTIFKSKVLLTKVKVASSTIMVTSGNTKRPHVRTFECGFKGSMEWSSSSWVPWNRGSNHLFEDYYSSADAWEWDNWKRKNAIVKLETSNAQIRKK